MLPRTVLAAALACWCGVAVWGQQFALTKDGYAKLGVKALADNNFASARKIANDCLAKYPADKKCLRIRDSANHRLALIWKQHLQRLPPHNLPEILLAWEQIAILDNSEAILRPLLQARANVQQVRDSGKAFVEDLHTGRVPVPKELPGNLRPYVPFFPELADLSRELKVHQAIEQSQIAERDQRLADALAALDPFRADAEIALRVRELKERSAELLTADIQRLLESTAESDLWLALERLASANAQAVPPHIRVDLAAQADRAATSRLTPLLDEAKDAASRHAAARLVQSKIPAAAATALPWKNLSGGLPGIAVAVKASGVAADKCRGLSSDALEGGLLRQLPQHANPSPDAQVSVSLEDVDCGVKVAQLLEEPINSTYVASQQQVSNPQFVRLQALLQQAQQELAQLVQVNAANPTTNRWRRLAQTLAESTAQGKVNGLAAQLNETAPFLSQPVILAYTPYRYRVAKSATVRAVFSVSDALTGFADALTVEGSARMEASGLRGVLPTDRSALSNQQPTLEADATLFQAAVLDLTSEVVEPLRRSLAQISTLRAGALAKSKGSPIATAGYAVLARDFGAEAESLRLFEALLAEADQMPLEKLRGLKPPVIQTASSPTAARRPSAARTPGARSATSRSMMLERVLDSVVTVVAGDKSGSGFFVGNAGHIITNAHVVEGAARIVVKTRSKESVLAKVVKLSLTDDLALLATTGFSVQGLPLGASSDSEVGADVIAVGSPLGLEGTVTRGIVSGLRQFGGILYLQIDAPINPGNSGGPLLTESGRVIGVNTWKVPAKITDSIGFAIAVDHVKKVFGALLGGSRGVQ